MTHFALNRKESNNGISLCPIESTKFAYKKSLEHGKDTKLTIE